MLHGHGPENAQSNLLTSKFTIDCLTTQANHNHHAFIDIWLQDGILPVVLPCTRSTTIDVVAVHLRFQEYSLWPVLLQN